MENNNICLKDINRWRIAEVKITKESYLQKRLYGVVDNELLKSHLMSET